jgi:hypothetical protein
LVIFAACVSDSEPPRTVKSLAKTKTVRPLIVPQPVTTPSPGNLGLAIHAEIDAAVLHEHVELFKGVLVHEKFDPLARGQLARVCCASIRAAPPPSRAWARRSSSVSKISFMTVVLGVRVAWRLD